MHFIGSPSARLRAKQLFSNTPDHTKTRPAAVERLPVNILQEIAGHISCLHDVFNFGSTSRRMWKHLLPRLYADVDLKTNKQCKQVLGVLAKRPGVARNICTLTVRPNNMDSRAPPQDTIDERTLSELLLRIAPYLTSLHSFSWDGLEMPDDSLWRKLQKSCPHLVNVGTTIGEAPVENLSPLFDFRDLRKFSFVVKCASLEWIIDGRPPMEKLPRRFWEMLVEHCPDLEELVIGGAAPSPRLFDIRPVSYGRWQRLRSLTLGDLAMQVPTRHSARSTPSFMEFLCSHPQLHCLKIQHIRGDTFPASLNLPRTALPALQTFSGPLAYIRSLPQPWLLQELELTGLQHSTSSFPRLFSTLTRLRSLRSLHIRIDLSLYTSVNRTPQPHFRLPTWAPHRAKCSKGVN
ncbi:hypothetical protein B0H15DRAFT_958014 [Mycena belliarum]|uniref:F-box domain-containing protein n=1 Tax=Mycena belliarum TaxID=1033014 RepID=A0AAD6XI08_9AGAR|nr:hypothetical protein B0H15DRAFT_958014 [Mycena belliae]